MCSDEFFLKHALSQPVACVGPLYQDKQRSLFTSSGQNVSHEGATVATVAEAYNALFSDIVEANAAIRPYRLTMDRPPFFPLRLSPAHRHSPTRPPFPPYVRSINR